MGIDYEADSAWNNPFLSKTYFGSHKSLLPVLPHLFAICLCGNRQVWCNPGRLARNLQAAEMSAVSSGGI